MSTIISDAKLGKVVFTDRATEKMRQHGLKLFHIIDTLKYGHEIRCSFNENFKQFVRTFDQYKQVQVVATDKDKAGKSIGATLLITCWARNI